MITIPAPSRTAAHPYTISLLAGAGLAATTLAATDFSGLTQRAATALGLASLVGGSLVGGIVYAVAKFDQVKLGRQKLYEDANKDSLARQIADLTAQGKAAADASLANQERMRESLHTLRNDAHQASLENHQLRDDLGTLRAQFMAASKQLHETDLLLHSARAEMHAASVELKRTAEARDASDRERRSLRQQIDGLRTGQRAQDTRLDQREHPITEGPPVPPIMPNGLAS